MRNYVIINGVNSLTIKGLAINELPPIVKAPMRVLQEEIDGRDGDIITDLGYGAYDKIMTIGLYDGYDINEIIAFFNNEGTIVFSDETDKYYNFKIIEQIDYERLIKFRTASITFHCQPFKYPLTETPVEITNEYVEAEGTNLTLTPTADAPMEIDLKGNTSQASDPTPDSPVDVNVVSGDNTIEICGKNLCDGELEQGAYNTSDGYTPISSNKYVRTKNFIRLQPNTTYTLNFNNSVDSKKGNYLFYGKSKNFLTSINLANNYTFTTSNDTYYLRIDIYSSNEFTPSNITNLQVEKGSTSSEYEAYTGQSQLISLGVENLFDISTITTGKTINEGTGNVTTNASNRDTSDFIKVKPNTQYTCSTTMTRYAYYDENKTFKNFYTSGTTITTNSDTQYIRFSYDNSLTNIQFEKGTKKNSYSPYGTTPIELNKIGNYQDYFYKTDKWYLHKEIGKVVLDGSENNINKVTTKTITQVFEFIGELPNRLQSNDNFYSNYFTSQDGDDGDTEKIVLTLVNIYIAINKTTASSVNELKTWLSTHNTIVYYVLATPQDIPLEDLIGE